MPLMHVYVQVFTVGAKHYSKCAFGGGGGGGGGSESLNFRCSEIASGAYGGGGGGELILLCTDVTR